MWYSTPTCIIYTFTPQRNNPRLDSPFVVGHVAKGRAEFCRPTGRDQYMARPASQNMTSDLCFVRT